ncbi:uncharacterized protein LOC101846853 [Aplysia californica]|uniref:Uncharacterized protein LOC101846853 n=1 Tax=Aplysia californica TaxID=6500 RepID=A0ABM1ADL8_APLCA|nr:uncharacterized protein LOC101846853 [Aplysia californica]
MYAVCLFVFIGLVFQAQALVGKRCTSVSECDAGECCQILSEFMVVSKRDAAASLIAPALTKTGTCQLYKKEGDHCNSFDAMNGYCSCEPGTYCHTYQEALPTAPATHMLVRSMLPPKPGYHWVSECQKKNP